MDETGMRRTASVTEQSKFQQVLQWVEYYTKPVTLPVLLAIIPTLYHYSVNVKKLTLTSLWQMLTFNAVLAILVFILCLIFTRFQAFKAANSAFVFLIFFNIYGVVYKFLLNRDVIRIKHYTLLPFMFMAAIYAIGFAIRWKDTVILSVWKSLLLITSVLVFFNLLNIVPAEIKKSTGSSTKAASIIQAKLPLNKKSPDIYYIIFDEFEGFQGMRDYWHYHGVDEFASFLKKRGFFVAEASRASSTDTLHEMATRLNYQEYPLGEEYIPTYFHDIASNRVMRFLKERGYTTVVFDETKLGYTAAQSIQADILYEYGSSTIPTKEIGNYRFYLDEFGQLIMDNTMLYAFSQKYKSNNVLIVQHTSMISFTLDNITSKQVPSPKFVHVHLLLPHAPFIFDENGSVVDSDHFTNWNYYIDNYKYSIKVAETMVDRILSQSDPKNPPIIILQSDHGARNHQAHDENSVILPNYPESLKTEILFALYMPGYDYSSLPQNVNPINTFPIVFNHLFNADIVLFK